MGTCQGEPGTIGPVTTIPSWVPPSDAGPGLNLRGPLELYFRRRVADRSGFVDYLTTDAPDRLESGGYVLDNGEGGARIGPFQTTFTLQDASFEWTNRQSFNVAAIASGVPITWSGGDPAGGYVVVSARISRQIEDWVVGQLDLRSLICVEKVEKQSFTIPQSLLASVPAAADLLTVHVAHVFYHRFPAPGLDFAEFHYSFGSTAAIPLR